MAQDEFVDLYALLGIEPSADVATVRKRITDSYLDAQNNLDHRNASKRLQYQQMYEVYLPQARHLLLDAGRRSEYDRYLLAYKSGKPLSQVEPTPAPVVESGGIASVEEEIPEMTEPDIDPEVLAQQREELWGKWKSGLNFGDEDTSAASAPANPAAGGTAAEAVDSSPASATAGPPPGVGERRAKPRGNQRAGGPEAARRAQIQTVALGEKEAPKARAAAHRLTPEELEKRTREEWERNRANQREQIIADAVGATGLAWSFVGGGVSFVVALIAMKILDAILSGAKSYPFGMSRTVFTLLGLVLAVGLAAVGALMTSKAMREKTRSSLANLSLEELQRRAKK